MVVLIDGRVQQRQICAFKAQFVDSLSKGLQVGDCWVKGHWTSCASGIKGSIAIGCMGKHLGPHWLHWKHGIIIRRREMCSTSPPCLYEVPLGLFWSFAGWGMIKMLPVPLHLHYKYVPYGTYLNTPTTHKLQITKSVESSHFLSRVCFVKGFVCRLISWETLLINIATYTCHWLAF